MTASELKPGNPANLSLALVLVALFLLVIPSKSQIPPIEGGVCSRTSLNFSTTDQYLSVSNSPLNGTAGTFEGWIQRDDWSVHADNIIFSNGIEYYTSHSLYLSLHPVGLHFRYGSITAGQGTAAYNDITTTLANGTWHHVAATWSHVSGTTTIVVFLDGYQIAASSVPYLIDPGASLFFGRNTEAANFGNGAMAEFRFWNFAKNSAQILADMNNTLTGDETGLIGYWPMNESGATVAANLVADGSDAAFVHPTIPLAWQQIFPITLSADGETYLPGTTYNFGMAGMGQSSDNITFTIDNVSTTAINLPDNPLIALTGADADQFTIDLTTTSDVLAPGTSSSFNIRFTPTSLGTKVAAVSIVTVDGCEDFFTLNLTGSATPTLSYSGPGFTETSTNIGEVEGYITVTISGDTFLDDGENLLAIGTDITLENIPMGLTPVLTLNSATEATLTLTGTADNHQRTDNESSIGFDFNETAFFNGSAMPSSVSGLGVTFTNNPVITFSGDGFTETADNTGAVEGSITITLNGDNFLDAGGILEQGTQVTVNDVPEGLTPVMNVVENAPPASAWEQNPTDGVTWSSVAYGDEKFVAVSSFGAIPVMTVSEGITYNTGLSVNTWTGVAYGSGLFVAVSYEGFVMTSADGIDWTSRTASEPNRWRSVTYGNGLFVAVALTGTNRVMTSTDGVTWVPSSAAEANSWNSVIYGEGLFVAVASDGGNRVMTSPDGINWTSREASEPNQWTDVTYGDGKFVAVSSDGTNKVMTSDDGISWVAQSAPDGIYRAVAYGGGIFVAVGLSGSSSAITSADGENWTAVGTNAFNWHGLAYGDEYFFAVGDGGGTGQIMKSSVIARSVAKLSFTGNALSHQTTDNVSAISFEFTDLAFAENIATDVVNATPSGSGHGISFNDNPAIAYSGAGFQETNANDGSVTGSVIIELTGDSFDDEDEDGLLDIGTEVIINNIPDGLTPVLSITSNTKAGENWAISLAVGSNWYSVTYGNGLFVATGANGYFITSPDGITWTPRTVTETNTWKSVTFGDGLFVAVSYNGTHRIMTSPDGINWTARVAPEANAWYSVTHGNGLFVAVAAAGSANRIMTSNDGINWTARATSDNSWTSITYGNGQFVAIAQNGIHRVITSPDGITWTARSAPLDGWSGVTYGEGLFVATANTNNNISIITSPDGITWTVRAAPEQNAWLSVTYANGLFVAAAASGSSRIMTSPDGIAWTARSGTATNAWEAITYGAGRFVAVGSTYDLVITSSSFSSAEAEITFTGKATSHANENDVAAITVEFTDAAFGSSAAAQVLNATGPASSGKGINFFTNTQTLTFEELPIKTYGNEPFEISATSSSGLPVSYTSSNENVATLEGNSVTIVGAGSATITAMQEGNEDFIAAEPVEQVLTVNKASQSISFSNLEEIAFEEEGYFELAATATSGLGTTYSSSSEDIVGISGSFFFLRAAGTVTITASQAGNENYFAAEDVSQVLIIHKGDQTITFEALPEKTFGDDDFELLGTVFSDARTVTYTSSDENVATVSDNIVTIVGAGSTIITASQSGNNDFNPANDVEQVLIVNKAGQTITFHELQAKTFGDADFNLTAEGGASGNTIVFTSSDESVATISGSTVTIVGAGTITITASQPGNDNYNPAEDVKQTLTVNKADQTITFSTLSVRTFGDPDFNLTATGGASNNPIVFASSDKSIATISGSTVTIVGAGITTITASQPGHNNYKAAENVSTTLTVDKANQQITFNSIGTKVFGDLPFNLGATASSALPVSYETSNIAIVSIVGNTATVVGAGSVTLTATQSGNSNYNVAQKIFQTFCVNPPQPSITSDFLNPEAPVLISSNPVGNQWYLNGDLIPGAVSQSYTVTQHGNYNVQTMMDNCGSDFAELFTVLITGLDRETATITLYPNPAKDKLVVKGITAETQVSIVSVTGVNKKVFSEWDTHENGRTIFIENLSEGVYILSLKEKVGTRQIKFFKK